MVEIESSYSFRVGLETINWGQDIESINTAKCMRCHGGNTFTVLEAKERWIDQIDNIIYNVEFGAMPMGADPLSAEVIGKIRSWSETGFE